MSCFWRFPAWPSVYVPIGMGSGICGLIAVRDLMGLDTEIVGVVADNAPAFALSFEAGHPVPTHSARTFADGMACRDPQRGSDRHRTRPARRAFFASSEAEIADAVRIFHTDTHNIAEGAGAAALAGLLRERGRYAGKRAAVICSGRQHRCPGARPDPRRRHARRLSGGSPGPGPRPSRGRGWRGPPGALPVCGRIRRTGRRASRPARHCRRRGASHRNAHCPRARCGNGRRAQAPSD